MFHTIVHKRVTLQPFLDFVYKLPNFIIIIIQVPKIRVLSASESIRGTRKVTPGPKSADSRDQDEEQSRTVQEKMRTCNYRTEACMYNKKETAKSNN